MSGGREGALRVAVEVALVGGFLLGLREASLTLEANAFVQPGQYLFAYLTVPVLAWMLLATVLLLPTVALGRIFLGPLDTARALRLSAGVLAFAGALSIVVPAVSATTARLEDVGGPAGIAALILWPLAATLAVFVGIAVATAVAWRPASLACWLRRASVVLVALMPILLLPLVRVIATGWKPPASTSAPPPAPGRPNIVLITIDTLRADHLGAYGDRDGLTPHLDGLASGGVMFRHAITSAPWTLPAIASLHTGLYPHHHGAGAITNRRDPLGRSALPRDSWTLAEALRARGYRTQAIVTNPYLARQYGLDRGFEGYENLTIVSEFFLAGARTTALNLLAWLWPNLVIGDRGETVSDRADRWLRHVDASRPFLLWLHYVDPHAPYGRSGASRHKSFRGDSLLSGYDDAGQLTDTSPAMARLRSGEVRPSAGDKEAIRSLYRNEVSRVDAAVGRVLATLEERGLVADTLVVCVSDHGEEFWEHGGVEHGHTLYDELVQVPLLMRWPRGLPQGTAVDAVVRTVDVAPTVLDLLGIPSGLPLDGATLLPVIRGDERTPRVALVESLLFAEERRAVRTADRKYVRWETGKEEVYDLVRDAGEERDLAGLTTAVDPLRELYAQVDLGGTVASLFPVPPDPGLASALRSLGYVE